MEYQIRIDVDVDLGGDADTRFREKVAQFIDEVDNERGLQVLTPKDMAIERL